LASENVLARISIVAFRSSVTLKHSFDFVHTASDPIRRMRAAPGGIWRRSLTHDRRLFFHALLLLSPQVKRVNSRLDFL